MNLSMLRYALLCIPIILCFMGYATMKRIIHTVPIFRILPSEPMDDAGRVRFWKTEPMFQRMRWDVWNFPAWGVIFLVLEVIIFVSLINPVYGGGAACVCLGAGLALLRRRKPGPRLKFDFRIMKLYGEM